jgi:glycerol-3-phosphate dehydrogenase (NAD(P)+)
VPPVSDTIANSEDPTFLNQPVEDLPLDTLTVLGAGAWGSTLAQLARLAGQQPVRLWSRRSPEPLAGAIAPAKILVSAVSMKGVVETIERLQALNLPPRVILVSATKGLDANSLKTPAQLLQEAFPANPLVVLSGPNLSQELAAGLPAATVVAGKDQHATSQVQQAFASEQLRVYTNDDPVGTELGGALKNVMAIALGVCDGLSLGANARAALITRALPEVIRVGTHLGGKPETFMGLSGLGDLLATCTSPLSRNYQVGYGLAHGKSLAEVLGQLQGTAEGVNTTAVLMRLAERERLTIPISREVNRLLQGEITPQEALLALMARDLKSESSLAQPF